MHGFLTSDLFSSFSLCSTNQGLETAVPVLLVDGYNVCGYWPKLKKHFMSGRLDVARQKLIDELVSFSVLKGLFLITLQSTAVLLPFWDYISCTTKLELCVAVTASPLRIFFLVFSVLDLYSLQPLQNLILKTFMAHQQNDTHGLVWASTSSFLHDHAFIYVCY